MTSQSCWRGLCPQGPVDHTTGEHLAWSGWSRGAAQYLQGPGMPSALPDHEKPARLCPAQGTCRPNHILGLSLPVCRMGQPLRPWGSNAAGRERGESPGGAPTRQPDLLPTVPWAVPGSAVLPGWPWQALLPRSGAPSSRSIARSLRSRIQTGGGPLPLPARASAYTPPWPVPCSCPKCNPPSPGQLSPADLGSHQGYPWKHSAIPAGGRGLAGPSLAPAQLWGSPLKALGPAKKPSHLGRGLWWAGLESWPVAVDSLELSKGQANTALGQGGREPGLPGLPHCLAGGLVSTFLQTDTQPRDRRHPHEQWVYGGETEAQPAPVSES